MSRQSDSALCRARSVHAWRDEALAAESGAVLRLVRVVEAGRDASLEEDGRSGGEAAAYLAGIAERLCYTPVLFWRGSHR